MPQPFDPADPVCWLARGRPVVQAAALADAWRRFPDLPAGSPLEERMARTRERVVCLRPLNEAIAAETERARVLANFAFVERRVAAGSSDLREAAILRARDDHGLGWNAAVRFSQGWYAAWAGWTADRHPDHREAYDLGFRNGGGDETDLFDAARRANVAAARAAVPTPQPPSVPARPLPSCWPNPSDRPRPTIWPRRLIVLTEREIAGSSGVGPQGSAGLGFPAEIFGRPGADQMTVIVLTASDGFVAWGDFAPSVQPMTAERTEQLLADGNQTERLCALVADREFDDILVTAQGDYLRIVDAAASALPLCRSMERTRNTERQQRQHLRIWLGRGAVPGTNLAAGHIRWSKIARGLTGKLGEFTARYAGQAATGRGHRLSIELADGQPATGFVTADGRLLDPEIPFSNKSRMREKMTAALRLFASATRLTAAVLAQAA
jgi:hypothetical protein